ncbi:DNA cytosine methyltransferase [Pseudomonas sp. P1B16]|uniref:DNA (cytosine-5-)-methyltransferase n=2 Tax=Pseudomonas TaxID=286 RepID=A0A6G6ISA5_PSENT|nr:MULTISPECIES: DNA cytosine methyltransferase [Pseudomonas]KYO76857.1 putative BsuMI modification methylase subunit YdiP [Pseudomonas aeruginosa]NWD82480.1 DNA cytosine methyltransferase [Pseudomonas reactans]NWE91160.1 DNA cytosine methyltransferase [Pseudomonas reactans]QIE86076.1 DNA cytosine methyltransferase [Pseudomonas nitroreducens]WPM25660.1 DNA cytosine methyltransferase [Pseudomonas sp. P1B16]
MHPQPHTPPLQYGSVCSGIEAVSLAWQPLGLEPAWFAEIEPFPCAVLAHHYPDVPNLGDMQQIAAQVLAGTVPAPDILVGGTPCQSFSIAGTRHGLDDPRGALTLSYVELANAIDQARLETRRPPAALVWENVPGVLSDRGNAFGCLLGALAGESSPLEPPGARWTHAGCVSGSRRRVAWRLLDAQYFGVAQRRRRVFLVASGRNDLDPVQVLFESEGLHRHSASCYAPWKNAATAVAPGVVAAGDYASLNQAYGEIAMTVCFGGGKTLGPINVAACLTAASGPKNDFDVETFMVQSVAGAISHTLDTANGGKGCGEDGTGKGVPVIAVYSPQAVAFAQNSRGELRLESGHGQLCGALSTGGGKPGQGLPMIASVSLRGREHGLAAELGNSISPTLRACSGGGDKGHVLAPAYDAHFLYTQNAADAADWSPWRVRRLMPVECERLQGMPDNYTLVSYRGKPAADGPRYKAIGNSMAVPCVAWLGQRLLQALA